MKEREQTDKTCRFKISENVTNYLDNATIHGLASISQSKTWYMKCIWIIVFLCLFTSSTYGCYEILDNYYKSETYLVHKHKPVKWLEMPSITICNANNYQASKIKRYSQYVNIEKFVNQLVNQSIKNRMFLPVGIYATNWSLGTENITFMKETRSGSEMLFANELDGWCTFQTFINCTKQDFIDSFYHSYLGVCKTFKSSGKYLQNAAGPLSGLSLKLFINEEDYAPMIPLDNGAGVTLLVHPPNVFPDPMDNAVLLQPGTLTRVSMRRKLVERLPYPYPSRCVDRSSTLLFSGPYTVTNCHQSCIQRAMYEECGILEAVVLYNLEKMGKKVPYKLDKNITEDQMACTLKFYDTALHGVIECDCPLPCKEEVITMKTSSSKWPSRADLSYYRPVLAKILNKTDVSEEFIYNNMLAVQIFFDSIQNEQVIEVAATSRASLFGSIGGVVGLFLGASCYSIVEFLVLIVKILLHCGKSNSVEPSSQQINCFETRHNTKNAENLQ